MSKKLMKVIGKFSEDSNGKEFESWHDLRKELGLIGSLSADVEGSKCDRIECYYDDHGNTYVVVHDSVGYYGTNGDHLDSVPSIKMECISNVSWEDCLTVGKIYDVKLVPGTAPGASYMHYLNDDNGEPMNTLLDLFKPITVQEKTADTTNNVYILYQRYGTNLNGALPFNDIKNAQEVMRQQYKDKCIAVKEERGRTPDSGIHITDGEDWIDDGNEWYEWKIETTIFQDE